jgi:hypothetical protein
VADGLIAGAYFTNSHGQTCETVLPVAMLVRAIRAIIPKLIVRLILAQTMLAQRSCAIANVRRTAYEVGSFAARGSHKNLAKKLVTALTLISYSNRPHRWIRHVSGGSTSGLRYHCVIAGWMKRFSGSRGKKPSSGSRCGKIRLTHTLPILYYPGLTRNPIQDTAPDIRYETDGRTYIPYYAKYLAY